MNSLLLSTRFTSFLPKKLIFTISLICCAFFAFAQSGSINGTVKTLDGKPADLVSVTLQGTAKGAIVNKNGNYVINNVKAGPYIIIATFTGFNPEKKAIEVKAGETVTSDFILSENSQQLNEVAVRTAKNRFAVNHSDDAAKMPLSNLENSQAYSTVSAGLMKDQGIYNLDDALKNIPGANRIWAATDRSGFGNGSSFVLRGFQLNTYLRNGIPANVSTTIDNANLESIEVLKGPSATLFGSAVTSYGGLINRVTKKPYDHTGGEISYSAGSYGFNRLAADINTPLDSAKTALFRLNLAGNTQQSWQDAGFHRDIFIAPSFSYKASDRLSFNFDAEIYASRGTTPSMFFFYASAAQIGVNSAEKLNLDYNRAYKSNDLYVNSSNMNFSGQMNYKLSDSWTSRTNISVVNTTSYGPMTYFYLLPGNNQIARAVWTIDGYDQTFDIQQNFTGTFKTGSVKHRVLAGLDYYTYGANVNYHEFMGTAGGVTGSDLFDVINSNGNIPNYGNFDQAHVNAAYTNNPTDTNNYKIHNKQYIAAAYVSDVINITDNLIANAAVRLDHFDYAGDYNPNTGTTSGGYHQFALSPKFGLVYQVVKDEVSLFGNYQNGFTNETGTDYQGQSFKPEQANQWEGGVKFNAFNGRLNGTASYYDIKVKDILRQDLAHVNFQIQNGTQISRGTEFELLLNPVDGFNISAGYAHNYGKYTNADADVNGYRPNSSGPQDMANLWLSYRFIRGGAKGLGFGFGGNYAGKALVESSQSSGLFYVPDYTLLNGTVFYDAGRFRLSANIDNLTNKKYWIGWYTVNPQQPRSYGGSIAFRF